MSDADVKIPMESVEEARTILGPLDSNARLIRDLHGVNVLVREGSLRLLGEEEPVAQVRLIVEQTLAALRKGRKLTTADVAKRIRSDSGAEGPETAAAPLPAPVAGPVRARTPGQERYMRSMEENDVVFSQGPAGTGKTYLAVAAAIDAVRCGDVRRIVLVRPAVEAGEKLGFLPGDFQAKVDPYLRPLYDALQDLLDSRQRALYLEGDIIEVCPLAYMRGRTLNRAFVILDEAQNTTVPQMLMFLTRLGQESRMVVTGDPSQVDLPDNVTSGLADAVRRLGRVKGIGVVDLDSSDVVRHPVVQRIVDAYASSPGNRTRGPKS